jgi:hypothetical protein
MINQDKLLLFHNFTILSLLTIALYIISIANDKSISLSHFKLAQYPFLLALFLNGLNFYNSRMGGDLSFQNTKIRTKTV